MIRRVQLLQLVGVVAASVVSLTACGSGSNTGTTASNAKATFPLESVTVGLPEQTCKDAIFSFVYDPKGAMGDTTQYLSRATDTNGGQYVVRCREGQCYWLEVHYPDAKPVAKEVGIKELEKLMPTDHPALSKVDDQEVKGGKSGHPVERYFFGDKYRGEITYLDKQGTQVGIISIKLDDSAS